MIRGKIRPGMQIDLIMSHELWQRVDAVGGDRTAMFRSKNRQIRRQTLVVRPVDADALHVLAAGCHPLDAAGSGGMGDRQRRVPRDQSAAFSAS
nr:hypothetical protein CFP56_11986 [Quercus suber]